MVTFVTSTFDEEKMNIFCLFFSGKCLDVILNFNQSQRSTAKMMNKFLDCFSVQNLHPGNTIIFAHLQFKTKHSCTSTNCKQCLSRRQTIFIPVTENIQRIIRAMKTRSIIGALSF